MESRNSQILSIRPTLEVSVQNSSGIEIFQTETLRPILKLQNNLIIAYSDYFIKQQYNSFYALIIKEQKKLIRQIIKKDAKFTSGLKHLTIALFTSEELNFYFNNISEINKRLSELLIERINSQIELLN